MISIINKEFFLFFSCFNFSVLFFRTINNQKERHARCVDAWMHTQRKETRKTYIKSLEFNIVMTNSQIEAENLILTIWLDKGLALFIPANLLSSTRTFPLASVPLSPIVRYRYHSTFVFVDVFPEYEHIILKISVHICREIVPTSNSRKIIEIKKIEIGTHSNILNKFWLRRHIIKLASYCYYCP